MPINIELCDARGIDVKGTATVNSTVNHNDGRREVLTAKVDGAGPYLLPSDATWASADVSITHADYVAHVVNFRWDTTGVWWGDPAAVSRNDGNGQTLRVPLSRIRYAPGQLPPYGGKPSGNEKGIYIHQYPGDPQHYQGIDFQLDAIPKIRRMKDRGKDKTAACLNSPEFDDGWLRVNFEDASDVNPGRSGGFLWLEYGSPDTQPTQPRFLVAVYVPTPDRALTDSAVDMLVFFSPTTNTEPYPASNYPYRDKYPYAAFAKEVTDPATGQKLAASVQPYAYLGLKYVLRPTHLAAMSLLSHTAPSKPAPVVVMPMIPRTTDQRGNVPLMWQPFDSRAGMYRLLLEIAQFLEREGFSGPAFSTKRFNGAVAPTSGDPAPSPPPIFVNSSVGRKRLGIRQIIISGYSSGSRPMYSLLHTPAIVSPKEFPEALFGADAAAFETRWTEFWALDLFLNEQHTGVKRAKFEQELRAWLMTDTHRLRLYQSGWTLEGNMPDKFFPALRKQVSPSMLTDPKLPARWSTEWREPAGHWSAVFFSSAALRAKTAERGVMPPFPISSPDGKTGEPAGAIHPFALQLGFGHATTLR